VVSDRPRSDAPPAEAPGPPSVDPFSPYRLGPIELRNRFVKAATFEGMSDHDGPTDQLVEFHRAIAAGGVALSTVAFCAVSEEGRATPLEMVLQAKAVPGLTRIAEAVHGEGAAVSAQIGHAGAVAAATGSRGRSPSPMFSPMAMRRTKAVDDDDIARITADFAAGATMLADCGFDAVEVHMGHGYLLSGFLSPRLNRRNDRWGGSLEHRMRFPRQAVEAVRRAVDGRLAVIVKLNMTDGIRGGLGPEESRLVARRLQADGTVDAIELTGGSSLQNPMFLFKGDAPVQELAAGFKQPIRLGMQLFGDRFLHSYPFEEGYFRPLAQPFREALDLPLVYVGGVDHLATVRDVLDDGFELVAMGRALLREPDLIERYRSGAATEGECIHCNRCMAMIHHGTHCPLLDPAERPGW